MFAVEVFRMKEELRKYAIHATCVLIVNGCGVVVECFSMIMSQS